jgi:DNA-binding XRE family transcriptional regulator
MFQPKSSIWTIPSEWWDRIDFGSDFWNLRVMLLLERIERRRVELGISRPQFARKLGMSRRRFWRFETGRTQLLAKDVPKVARALRSKISELYGERPWPNEARR